MPSLLSPWFASLKEKPTHVSPLSLYTSVPPSVACLRLSGLAASAHAQNAFYTTGTYTIDAIHSVAGDANVGEDSSGSLTDSMGNPYNPTVNLVTGGSVGNYLVALDRSMVTVSRGSVGNELDAKNSSTVTVSGGSFSLLIADNSSAVTVSGGTFGQSGGINFFDGTTGSFTLVGSNLLATKAGTDTHFGGTDHALSGTLQSGTNLKGYVLNVQSGSTFTLQAVPEPGSVALLVGLSMTGLGLLARYKRSRKPRKSAGY